MTGHELDQLIDSALPGYCANPAPELEKRVLLRVQRRAPRWLPFAGAAAAAAALMCAPWFLDGRPEIAPPRLITSLASHPPLVRPAAPSPVRRTVARSAPLASYPLSPRENLLAEFAQAHPVLAGQVLAESPERMAGPLLIPPVAFTPIVIEPLGSPGGE